MASIVQAQAQFADGKYPAARTTLLATLRRNRKSTDEDPRALAAAWYALARVTLHNGDSEEYRVAALRSGIIMAKSDRVTLAERVSGEVLIADTWAMSGDPNGAVRRYRKVGTAARARGDIEISELMELRAIYARSGFDGRTEARRSLERAAQDTTLSFLQQLTLLNIK